MPHVFFLDVFFGCFWDDDLFQLIDVYWGIERPMSPPSSAVSL